MIDEKQLALFERLLEVTAKGISAGQLHQYSTSGKIETEYKAIFEQKEGV